MDFREIRSKFLAYFEEKGHEIVESSSLIPKEDPTLLFTNAGMVQFKRLFLGEEKRPYTRAATSQKCVRAGGKHNDLENVGHTPRHHTFFEMLGNFSFGDYFKEDAITWSWDLLTRGYGLPEKRLSVSVFEDDEEAWEIWSRKIGLPSEKIVRLGGKDNFWAMGETGPCGPCSEIHFDQGASAGCGRPECAPGCDCDRYLEIWNLVFTQFDRSTDGVLTPLPRPNIDTGMGLERLASVVQGVRSNYETDLFKGVIERIEDLSGKEYNQEKRNDVAFRVIADHSRAVAFLIGDGIMPSNEGRGYVLRRIIRRAIRFGQVLGLADAFLRSVSSKVIEVMGKDYGELERSRKFIEGVVENEEKRFADTLKYSMRVLNDEIEKLKEKHVDTIPGELAFKLYDTYGLSVDIVQDVARDEHLRVDLDGFQSAMSKQRSVSQESWKGSGEEEVPEAFRKLRARGVSTSFLGYETLECGAHVIALLSEGREVKDVDEGREVRVVLDRTPFYGQAGGQVGDVGWIVSGSGQFRVTDTHKYDQNLIVHEGRIERGRMALGDEVEARVDGDKREATARNHTATHLLHASLREVLGEHVKQAGSLVSPERLRFDFSHFTQVQAEKLGEIEVMVNRLIRQNHPVEVTEMSREDAMKTGAVAIFEERYGEKVRVVSAGEGVSRELCGGTHIGRTGSIGLFRIVGESAVAANIRRIEALTGERALLHDQDMERELNAAAALLKTGPEHVVERLERLIREKREKDRAVDSLKAKMHAKRSQDLLSGAKEIRGVSVVSQKIEASSQKELRGFADKIKDKLRSGIVVLGTADSGKVMLVCMVTGDLTDRYKAGDLIKELSHMVGGKGGGRPDMAQGGGNRPEELDHALEAVYGLLERMK